MLMISVLLGYTKSEIESTTLEITFNDNKIRLLETSGYMTPHPVGTRLELQMYPQIQRSTKLSALTVNQWTQANINRSSEISTTSSHQIV